MQGWCKRRMGVQEIDNLLWNNLQETSHFKQLIDLAKQVLEIFLHLNLINVENNGDAIFRPPTLAPILKRQALKNKN